MSDDQIVFEPVPEKSPVQESTPKKDSKKSTLSIRERAQILTNKLKVDIFKKYGLPKGQYHYHWANMDGENGSNVEVYEEVGYAKCIDKNGNTIRRRGRSLGQSQILMRIPLDIYEEIQTYKLEEALEIERSMGRKNIPGLPEEDITGKIKIGVDVNRK